MMEPMLSLSGTANDLVNSEFIYEPKLDGIRAFLIKNDNEIKLVNRKGRDVTSNYPELQLPDNIHAESCMLDGELIVYDAEGNPDFNQLLRKDQLTNPMEIKRLSKETPAIFAAFDILALNGKNLAAKPLSQRKEILEPIVPTLGKIQRMYYTKDGIQLWDFIMARHLEGVMAKHKDSPYITGKRTSYWLKIKNFKTQDCIIIGYSTGARPISSLGLAAYVNGKLRFLGKVGTGFTNAFIDTLKAKLEPMHTNKPSVKIPDRYEDMQWVKPLVACEVQYLEFGSEGMMRNPSFLRLRPDKPLKDCILDLPTTPRPAPSKRRSLNIMGNAN